MIFDTEKLVAEFKEARQQTGEDYLSLTLEICQHRDDAVTVLWGSYTPSTSHTKRHTTPEAALADTVEARKDPAKLLARAEQLENEAISLRARIGGAK